MALTRARRHLIIVGNRSTLASNSIWRAVLEQALRVAGHQDQQSILEIICENASTCDSDGTRCESSRGAEEQRRGLEESAEAPAECEEAGAPVGEGCEEAMSGESEMSKETGESGGHTREITRVDHDAGVGSVPSDERGVSEAKYGDGDQREGDWCGEGEAGDQAELLRSGALSEFEPSADKCAGAEDVEDLWPADDVLRGGDPHEA